MPNRPRRAKPIKREDAARERPKTAERGYDTRHVKLREQLLAEHPICQVCNAAFSHHAHHLRYPAESLADYLALCESCHMKQHQH
jgi:hypothetical protein